LRSSSSQGEMPANGGKPPTRHGTPRPSKSHALAGLPACEAGVSPRSAPFPVAQWVWLTSSVTVAGAAASQAFTCRIPF
jgi:hypothetical protein